MSPQASPWSVTSSCALSADCTIAARVTAPPTMFTLESGETSARGRRPRRASPDPARAAAAAPAAAGCMAPRCGSPGGDQTEPYPQRLRRARDPLFGSDRSFDEAARMDGHARAKRERARFVELRPELLGLRLHLRETPVDLLLHPPELRLDLRRDRGRDVDAQDAAEHLHLAALRERERHARRREAIVRRQTQRHRRGRRPRGLQLA